MTDYRFNSLEDFLISHPLTVDVVAEDGWGARYPIKGREVDATILFADISGFSRRTEALTSTETLAFVNHFFSWVTAEALTNSRGMIDKYIGDEIMIVFSREFGSTDPFAEAVAVARRFGESDAFSFSPHIGIASGAVTIGYVGTPVKYNCSVFGHAVAVAARCAGVRTQDKISFPSIVFPVRDLGDRKLLELFPPRRIKFPDGEVREQPSQWEIHPARTVTPKNMSPLEVIAVENATFWVPTVSAEEWARRHVAVARKNRQTTT